MNIESEREVLVKRRSPSKNICPSHVMQFFSIRKKYYSATVIQCRQKKRILIN